MKDRNLDVIEFGNPDPKFAREIQDNFDLTVKHNFKKHAGRANGYYRLRFDNTLDNDLRALHAMYKSDSPFKILGIHTNILITERGYNGLFVDIDPKNAMIEFDKAAESFMVSANATVTRLINHAMGMGYNFSSLTGIPGMVGAGVVGNSSYSGGRPMGGYVQKIVAYDFEDGGIVEFQPDENFFSIRDSFIKRGNSGKTRYFVKSVVLKAEHIGEAAVKELFDAQMNERREALRISFREGNAGAFFMNPYLRAAIGKSMTQLVRADPALQVNFGGAGYSPNGNRLFTTQTDTTDADCAKFFAYVVDYVRRAYGVELHKEVLILDHDGEIDLATFIQRNS